MRLKRIPDLRPLTPDFGAFITPTTEADKLRAEVRNLRQLLAFERRRHAKLESALARYQSILERNINDQSQALAVLREATISLLAKGLTPRGQQ
jgi:hypothetical protein